MPIDSNVSRNIATLEYQKFARIFDDTRFPPITAILPGYDGIPVPQVWPKYAVLTYDIGQNGGPEPINSLPFGNNASTDAFGRLRTAVPDTIHNCKQTYDNAPLIYNTATVNGGVAIYDNANSSTVMQVSANGDAVIRQTRLYCNYQPGKGQLAFITFSMPDSAGLVSRIGLFDGDTTTPYANPHGFYFENNNGNLSFNIANYGGGESSQTVPQSAWSIDTLDGNGPSQITLDVTKAQILVIDYEWLGVGRVRYGFNIDGITYYAHAFNNANNIIYPYLKDPNNPVRYEVRSIGGAGVMRQICSSVMSEGGSQENGILYSCNTGVSGIGNISAGQRAPIINIRLKANRLSATLNVQDFAAMASSTTNSLVEIVLNGTVSGTPLSFNGITNSNVEYAVCNAGDSIANGTILYSAYFNKSSNTTSALSQSLFAIGSNIDGTRDVLSVCITPYNGNERYFAALNWLEFL
jgi:hypothetical protein